MDCILWTGRTWAGGRYGMDTIEGKSMGAHRAAWIRVNGKIPKGLVVCHKCDNGLCVNVKHLFLGTQKENMQDCVKKGRMSHINQKGHRNHNAKPGLRERNIGIRKDRLQGLTYSQLKNKYGIKSNGHLRNIILSDPFRE